MAASINYPSALDTDATVGGGNEPDGTTALDATNSGHPKHSVLHQNIGEAIQKIQTKVGKTDSSPSANKVLHSSATGDSAWTDTPTVTSLTATNLTGELVTAAQPQITSLGSLTGLDVNGVVKVNDGTAGAPTFTFDSDEDTGLFCNTAGQINVTTAGTKRVTVDDTGNIYLDTSGGSYVALNPGTGTGNNAEWALGYGVYSILRNSSTAAEKENISAGLGSHLTADMIDSVVPKMWNRITAPGYPEIGPIADEIDEVSPFLAAHGTDADGDQILTGINNTAWMSLMTLALQDIRTRLEALEG